MSQMGQENISQGLKYWPFKELVIKKDIPV